MKTTYRAKFNALRAMNDGYSLITIRHRNETVAVWLDDIIDTPNGEKVQEYGEPNKYCCLFVLLGLDIPNDRFVYSFD